MKRLSCLLLGILLVFSLCACQQAAPSSGEAPDQQAITEEATEYFNQMMDGDFETFFNALPQGVQDNISAETIQETWEEEVDKLGGLPENTSPDVSCYVPEHSDQIRVEFVIPCDKGNFKVFINYFPDGSLYNYVTTSHIRRTAPAKKPLSRPSAPTMQRTGWIRRRRSKMCCKSSGRNGYSSFLQTPSSTRTMTGVSLRTIKPGQKPFPCRRTAALPATAPIWLWMGSIPV